MAQQTVQSSGSISMTDLNGKLNGGLQLGNYYRDYSVVSRYVEDTSTRVPTSGYTYTYTPGVYGTNDKVWAWGSPDGYPSNLGPVWIVYGSVAYVWGVVIDVNQVSSWYYQNQLGFRSTTVKNYVFYRGSLFNDNFTPPGYIGYNRYPRTYSIAADEITHREPATNAAVPTSGAISFSNLYGVVSYTR